MAISKVFDALHGHLYAKKVSKGQVYIRLETMSTHAKITLSKEQRIELAHFLLEDIN